MATGRIPTTANSPLTAKGDLFTFSTGSAKLAVGNNGETLVADSSAATGLSYQNNFAAGKNKIINGDFGINQRAFTTSTAVLQFVADRFVSDNDPANGTVTKTLSAFTPGAAPVSGYEATNYFSIQTTGQSGAQTYSYLYQSVEDVRTFAGQTVTFSFWAKAASGTPKISLENRQAFGSGGSAAVNTNLGFVTLSTSWARYSVTGTVPSVSGKTIVAGSISRFTAWVSAGTDYTARTNSIGIQTNTFDIWGVQVEAGSVATAFQTATGSIQGELAACQRYYYRITSPDAYTVMALGFGTNTTNADFVINFPTLMRVKASSLDYASLSISDGSTAYSTGTFALVSAQLGLTATAVRYVHGSGALTNFRPYRLEANNNTAAYLGFNAEL